MGVCALRQLADHDEVRLIDDLAAYHKSGVFFFAVARLTLGVVTRRGYCVQQSLRAFAERVETDVVDVRRGVRVVFIDDEVRRRAGVLVLGVLGQRAHPAAACLMRHGVRLRDVQPLRDGGGRPGYCFRVIKDALCLCTVNGRALHLGHHFKASKLRMIGRIHGVSAHVVKALSGLFCALEIASGALVVGTREPARAVVNADPAVYVAEVKHLPRLKLYRLPAFNAAYLPALTEPADDPVGAGRVEDVGEIGGVLPLEVTEEALARLYFCRTAHGAEFTLCHLLRVDRSGMVQPTLLPCWH